MISANGEQISPYEQGELEFNRSTEIKSKVSGEVNSTQLQDYMKVTSGQVLVQVSGEDNENEMFRIQENLKTAREALETAQKNKQNLQATAPIDGTVVGLAISPGDEVTSGTAVISIMDTTQMLIEATVDERNISYVTAGMMVEIDQWGNITSGIIDSVSLSGKYENGMTTFPVKIIVDNQDGMLNSSSIIYRIQASQSDDCLLVPTQCVKSVADPETGESIDVVFVKSPERPETAVDVDGSTLGVPTTGYYAVPVTIGISDNYNVELVSGVDEGMEVFTQVLRQNS